MKETQLQALEKEKADKLPVLSEAESYKKLISLIITVKDIDRLSPKYESLFIPLNNLTLLLRKYELLTDNDENFVQKVSNLQSDWKKLSNESVLIDEKLLDSKKVEILQVKEWEVDFNKRFSELNEQFKTRGPVEYYDPFLVPERNERHIEKYKYNLLKNDRKYDEEEAKNDSLLQDLLKDPFECYILLNEFRNKLKDLEAEAIELKEKQSIFDLQKLDFRRIELFKSNLHQLKRIWDLNFAINSELQSWTLSSWKTVNTDQIETQIKNFLKTLRTLPKDCRQWSVYQGLDQDIKNFSASLPLISDLKQDSMRQRHWKQLVQVTGVSFSISDKFTLRDMLNLNLNKYSEEVEDIVVKSKKEQQMENQLETMSTIWGEMNLTFIPYTKDTEEEFNIMQEIAMNRKKYQEKPLDPAKLYLITVDDEFVEQLEGDQVGVQNMLASKYSAHFLGDIKEWHVKLRTTDSVIQLWLEVQKTWKYLVDIFQDSEDIREQLPDDSARFDKIDTQFKDFLKKAVDHSNILKNCNRKGLEEMLSSLSEELSICQKALNKYLEMKRKVFPRFYFISVNDLLDILSKSRNPLNLQNHLSKVFEGIKTLKFDENNDHLAFGMNSKEGEYVEFTKHFEVKGAVENYLNDLIDMMRLTLKNILAEAVNTYDSDRRLQWIKEYPAQIVLVASQIWWTTEVNYSFEKLLEGKETALIDYNKQQKQQILDLIGFIRGKLTKLERKLVMTLCMLDVHARDVVANLINQKVESSEGFAWQSQLRMRWDDKKSDCFINNVDAEFRYGYEYLGNQSRLVITPLTDRCYITLSQSLHLCMAGAPAGPAGTGKTETVKDLGKGALGLFVLTFNCSEEMDYKSIGNIFKGLAQTGAWGCFDEFNRISISVLSVVAVQVKAITDSLKAKLDRFSLLGDEISLVPSVGLFITMNPGYAGRTELPENLKALFRPCSMVVPDYAMIAENMLMAEGFYDAKELAKKFTTLYSLCKDLLSKQHHYDWGLRAIKSVLVVAGALRRADPDLPEELILMRALRDFNIPKIVTADMLIFLDLINDLFPGMDPPRKVDVKFQKVVEKAIEKSGLQSDNELFVLKILQLKELFEVRHAVFVIGPAGAGKTETWKMLAAAEQSLLSKGQKVLTPDINPKTQPARELFGYMNNVTREWKDGILSNTMRNLSRMNNEDPKWLVLDGDVDPGWIESMNTVLDDNKVLTLASNERIPLTNSMRMLFEVSHLSYATPATVSRGGILYINETDIGWMPYVRSWIETRPNSEHGTLLVLFETYVQHTLNFINKELKSLVDINEFNLVQTLCAYLTFLLSTEESDLPIIGCQANSLIEQDGEYKIDIFNNFEGAKALYDERKENKDQQDDIIVLPNIKPVHETGLFKNGVPTEYLENIFIFAVIWAFGGCLKIDQMYDYKDIFSKWFKGEFRNVRIPGDDSVFNFGLTLREKPEYFENFNWGDEKHIIKKHVSNPEHYEIEFVQWKKIYALEEYSNLQNKIFEMDGNSPRELIDTFVETPDTFKYSFFTRGLLKIEKPILIVGDAGTGKTAFINYHLKQLDEEAYISQNINFNYYTDAHQLQNLMEAKIERKAGRNFAPKGHFNLVTFIDDLNMPLLDTYNTQSPVTLLRQHIDHGHWYDRSKLELMNVSKAQYIASMNPGTGSYNVNLRLQRHFAVLGFYAPSTESVEFLTETILKAHMYNVHPGLVSIVDYLSKSLVAFHNVIEKSFLPTAIKFHYKFNFREIFRVFEGLLNINKNHMKSETIGHDLVKLFYHELSRVYGDRLVDEDDQKKFTQCVEKNLEEFFPKKICDELAIVIDEQHPILSEKDPTWYSHFTGDSVDSLNYQDLVKNDPENYLNKVKNSLNEYLEGYKDLYPKMNLIFFNDAISHILRISRVLQTPGGHLLLVGIGGSGKQSLSRLAGFINNMEIFQITVTSNYGVTEFYLDLQQVFIKCGVKDTQILFLLSDSQIKTEKFFIAINDFLSTGDIPGLFTDDSEIENIINSQRNEVKLEGLRDTPENCWAHFLGKVKRNLHICLALSPVGSALRDRVRKFPTLVNCCSIDWFHAWPRDALIDVARRNIIDSELDFSMYNPEAPLDDSIAGNIPMKNEDGTVIPSEERNRMFIERIVHFMAFAHSSSNEIAQQFLETHRRYVYTTPKSFLELIELYKHLFDEKKQKYASDAERLDNGLVKLKVTAQEVDGIKEDVEKSQIVAKAREKEAQELLADVTRETEVVNKQKAIAEKEQEECEVVEIEVSAKQKAADDDLSRALPAVAAAEAALDTLNKDNLVELKSLASPPAMVAKIMHAVMTLIHTNRPIQKEMTWQQVKKLMGNVAHFLAALKEYDKENIPIERSNYIKAHFLDDENFNAEAVLRVSVAASGICDWVVNIITFYDIHCEVEPKRIALAEATETLNAARAKLKKTEDHVRRLTKKLNGLKSEFEEATKRKQESLNALRENETKLDIANRLINGLASEKDRWGEGILELRKKENSLVGDILLVAAFCSYVGPFNKHYRKKLVNDLWIPEIRKLGLPLSKEAENPLTLLVDDAKIAEWNNDGLPSDEVSVQNAAILSTCKRWPLIIDPQLQALNWLKNMYALNPDIDENEQQKLNILQVSNSKYLDTVERSIQNGEVTIIENMKEEVDVLLQPIVERNFTKKGRNMYLKMGGKELEFDQKFKLFLQTKMLSPHYQPEVQAQLTLINFSVTEEGLEEQLLGFVVKKESPELEEKKSKLMREQNEFKIRLKSLEDNLLKLLNESKSTELLTDTSLIENLETTKATSKDIAEKVVLAQETEKEINEKRESYRPVASQASMLYFLLIELNNIDKMYQFSLNSFVNVFDNAIDHTPSAENLQERVDLLIDNITYKIFRYTTRGLFERHKLIFSSKLCFQTLLRKNEIEYEEFDFLIRMPRILNVPNPLSWLDDSNWSAIVALSKLENFCNLTRDIESASKRWREWFQSANPESSRIPQDYNNLNDFQKMLLLRVFRPDRLIYALRTFVGDNLGERYVNIIPIGLEETYKELSPSVPAFFILSPGVDPLKQVELLGDKLGYTQSSGKWRHISLGQGQTPLAEAAITEMSKTGGWVILENIHLTVKWLPYLEKEIERCQKDPNIHPDFRLFLTAEPPASSSLPIPQGILENSVKMTNEPPTGISANMYRALDAFTSSFFESCSKTNEFKSILFSLCFFHSLIIERKKFGPIGWNSPYPFSQGDLTICGDVARNFLEDNVQIPWSNLKYIFGEIMYGGHISDDIDRRLCATYLKTIMTSKIFEETPLGPDFKAPPLGLTHPQYIEYIETLPSESPVMFGLHPNAEIDFLNTQSTTLFDILLDLQPKDTNVGGGQVKSREEIVLDLVESFLSQLPEGFEEELLDEYLPKHPGPYENVWSQEFSRMQGLIKVLRSSLLEVEKALNGELTISTAIEASINSLYLNRVPSVWTNVAYPSQKPLGPWFVDLMNRIQFLRDWSNELNGSLPIPKSIWLSGLFNPQSLLTAVMQVASRKNQWPLDKMALITDVTKKNFNDISAAPREGCYLHGLHIEGARWDLSSGVLAESFMKDLAPELPVIYVKAQLIEKCDFKDTYECPVYYTKQRGPTFVWNFNLRTKQSPDKWILAGVALILTLE
eukprot:TRINITY_DN3265_c0_g6_i1.p1 TRINITY_DN3265_c0_g6~~TRINITY_DN3265_c0_g6_i1.p1  ORF type:complete len:3839 (+),score=1299.73 TRINITY_DN3265_c0_g6_i1:669-11519(+)